MCLNIILNFIFFHYLHCHKPRSNRRIHYQFPHKITLLIPYTLPYFGKRKSIDNIEIVVCFKEKKEEKDFLFFVEKCKTFCLRRIFILFVFSFFPHFSIYNIRSYLAKK